MKYLFLHLVENDAEASCLLLPIDEQTKPSLASLSDVLAAAMSAAQRAMPPDLPHPSLSLSLPMPEAIYFDESEEAVRFLGINLDTIENGQVLDLPEDEETILNVKRQALWACWVDDPELVLDPYGYFVIQALPKGGGAPVETLELELQACVDAL